MREMKDSGIEWIGQIPKEWNLGRIKYYSEVTLGKMLQNEPKGNFDTNEYYLCAANIGSFTLNLNSIKKMWFSKAEKNKLNLSKGDLLVIEGGDVGSCVYLEKDLPNIYFQNSINRVKSNYKLDIRLIKYILFLAKKVGYIDLICNKATISHLTKEKLEEIFCIVPENEEQQQIADFLDTKCSEIDATAEDIQKEISLLEDYKKSVITEAVTKGLNPDAEMKDSGVKWLPKIPKHWKVIPSKYLFANSDIRRQTGDEQLTASQKYGIITQKDYTAKENAQIVLATQGLEKWKHVEPNDFIISLRSFQGGLEMSKITGCITWHYVVLKAQKKVYHKYYKWLFKSARYINALQGTCNFIRDGQDLRFSNFALVPLFELPLEEQQQIADYLDTKCSEIDTLIADKKRQLDILTDYKKSLIYEYITGKKEVPVKDF